MPRQWQEGLIKGWEDPANYRGIMLVSVVSKALL